MTDPNEIDLAKQKLSYQKGYLKIELPTGAVTIAAICGRGGKLPVEAIAQRILVLWNEAAIGEKS